MLSDHPAATAPRRVWPSVLAALLLALPVFQSAQSQRECSRPKVYVRVAFVQGLEQQLNRDYPTPHRPTAQWVAEISSAVVREIRARAGNVDIIPLEQAVFYDDNPQTPKEENRFNERPRGEYHLDFILSVITARNEYGVADPALHPNYWAAGEIGDADRDGVYLSVRHFEHPDLYAAIRSTVDLMMFTGLQPRIERHERTHFNALRDPTMTLEVLDPGFVSPEPGEQTVNVKVETKDCRERFGEGTNIWVQKKTDRGETDVVKGREAIPEGNDWKAKTAKDGKIEFEYKLKRGDQAAREPVNVKIIGRGQKEMPQVVYITAKTLEINVEPVKDHVAPGDQTRVFVRLLKVDDKKVKEPVKGRTLTLKVTGLEDGKLEPKDKIATDENGLGTLTYTAGERDKEVKIEASYQPDGYETRFTNEGKINTGAYSVTVDLEMSSPFVADGRMSIAALGIHIVFDQVFIDQAAGSPLGGGNIKADPGKGGFTRFVLNDVEGEPGDRHRPTFKKSPPSSVAAQLTLAPDVDWLERMAISKNSKPVQRQQTPPSPSPGPPLTAKLVFMTKMGLHAVVWQSHLGSAELSDFRVQFQVPWRDLLAGEPITVTVPYEAAAESGDKGTWTLAVTPKNAGK